MTPDEVPDEWAAEGAKAVESWDTAIGLELFPSEEEQVSRAVIAAVAPAIKGAALREFAELIRETYPEDVFIPPTRERLREVHEYLVSTGGALDALSAHIARSIANILEVDAEAIEEA